MGPYDNDLRVYVEDEGIERGQWLEDADRHLFILPHEPPDRECPRCDTLHGPDSAACEECGEALDPTRNPEVRLHEVPRDSFGPDGETLDRIHAVLRKSGRDRLTAKEMRALGLAEVPNGLKRFDAKDGYYHA